MSGVVLTPIPIRASAFQLVTKRPLTALDSSAFSPLVLNSPNPLQFSCTWPGCPCTFKSFPDLVLHQEKEHFCTALWTTHDLAPPFLDHLLLFESGYDFGKKLISQLSGSDQRLVVSKNSLPEKFSTAFKSQKKESTLKLDFSLERLQQGKPKRARRPPEEVERLYKCGWKGECEKSYGTLSHLNTHIRIQKHGEQRKPEEFKEFRRIRRNLKKHQQSSQIGLVSLLEAASAVRNLESSKSPNSPGKPMESDLESGSERGSSEFRETCRSTS